MSARLLLKPGAGVKQEQTPAANAVPRRLEIRVRRSAEDVRSRRDPVLLLAKRR